MTSSTPSSAPLFILPRLRVATGALMAGALCAISFYNYLLFHTLVEMFSVVVAAMIFVLAWTGRAYIANHYLLFLGIAYLFVGFIDLLHTLAYKGMGVFPNITANEPTQLWILARYMESLSLLAASFYARRRASAGFLAAGYALITFAGLIAILRWNIFPDCFVEGQGLTGFKIVSEYVVCGILLVAGVRLFLVRHIFDAKVCALLWAAMTTTMIAELAFTFYVSVYGLSNMIGHLFKLLSFLFIFEALVRTGIQEPLAVLFHQLKQSQEELFQEKEKLKAALKEIKTLQGLLPICSYCKKIRDNQGDWHSLEVYLRSHTNAMLSHGICPDCLRKHYPDMADQILKTDTSQKSQTEK
ncbi:MASE3 domain-containing protein [Desulfosoma caldarium]|uniref:Membrane-associated sensor protein n=1 Tax=Desulfosoma caldarium TaxID=610254 RepID=A0A3N1UFW9_9BACT|nr:MASE3 domain-containing protein [Desulfosoma caldarium]ROQ90215.1 membrane-associated sensor protein [Desulfosoma caldarium]